MNIMNLFLVYGLAFHCLFVSYEASTCSDCCTITPGDDNSIEVSCSSIATNSSFLCFNECLINMSSSSQQPLDVKLTDCNQSLFPDNYFESFKMAGLGMQKCGLTEIPSRIYGKSCSSMANQMLLGTNGITTIDPKAFTLCSKLTSLDLSNNYLTKINNVDFQNLGSLIMLSLSGNQIESVEGFSRSSVIVDLYLHDNIIFNISSKAFAGMTRLSILTLNHNALQTLEDGVFDSLQLTSLNLDSNQFVCDCSLLWLKTWLKAHSTLDTGAECNEPMVGPIVSTPFCVSTTDAFSTTTLQTTSISSSLLTSSSTASASQTALSTTDLPNALTTPSSTPPERETTQPSSTLTTSLAISSTVLSSTTLTSTDASTFPSLESSLDPITSSFQTTTSEPFPSTIGVQSSTTQTLTSSLPTTLFFTSTVLIPSSQTSTISTDVTTSNMLSTTLKGSTPDENKAIVSYIDIQEDMTLVWSTNESKVMILFGPINGNCSNYTINLIFGNMTAGVHAVVIANQSDYQIQVDKDDQLYLVCITNAQLNINIQNLYCNISCLTTFASLPSTVPATGPTATTQSTISLSIAIGLICAIVFICLIIITVLLCVLRCTSKKKSHIGSSNSGNVRPRPLPARPSNDSQQTIKCPPERNGLPNPLYNGDDNIRDNRSYLYLEPPIPEGCDIDEPINSDTYELISLKDSETESKNLTPTVSVD